jgi:mannitol/fructose-specific phosphotransferase system IIA component (Ntr-type)
MTKKMMKSAADKPMDLNEFFGPKPNEVNLQAVNRWDAIDELVDSLVASHKIKPEHREEIWTSLRKREVSMSTGIGFGVGLPHASTEFVSELTAAVGRSSKGIEFDALDGKPVNLVMLFLVPQGEFPKYLNTLANLAKLLQDDDFRAGLARRFE